MNAKPCVYCQFWAFGRPGHRQAYTGGQLLPETSKRVLRLGALTEHQGLGWVGSMDNSPAAAEPDTEGAFLEQQLSLTAGFLRSLETAQASCRSLPWVFGLLDASPQAAVHLLQLCLQAVRLWVASN